jgi:hypothetical protein
MVKSRQKGTRSRNRRSRRVGGNRTIPHLQENLLTIKKSLDKYYNEIDHRCGNDNIRNYTSSFKTITEILLEKTRSGYGVTNRYIEVLIEGCSRWKNLLHSRQGQCADETVQKKLYTIESIISGCVDAIERELESRSPSDPVDEQR